MARLEDCKGYFDLAANVVLSLDNHPRIIYSIGPNALAGILGT
jgi:hypothetical protein